MFASIPLNLTQGLAKSYLERFGGTEDRCCGVKKGWRVRVVRRARAAAKLGRLPEPPSRVRFRPYSVPLVPSRARAHQS